ncbi:MAG: DUF6798 domain-containing protein [Terracidiphilus sp.]
MKQFFQKQSVGVRIIVLLVLSGIGFLVMGYHPGAEDDAFYLTAVKADLNPALFPHDSDFFKLQVKETVFDTWMAAFVRGTGISVSWAELLWQFLSLFLIVLACWSIVSQLFQEAAARWASVALVTAMFTLPVAGTALYIVDQYMHPRNLATALILIGVSRIMAGKSWQAVPLAGMAFLLHPLMSAFGISFCCVLALTLHDPLRLRHRSLRGHLAHDAATPVAALIPFGWIFRPPQQDWLAAIQTRHLYHLYEWTWYEWLGAIGPLVLFWLVARVARTRGEVKLSRFAMAVLIYGIFQQVVAMVILSPMAPIGFTTLEPMRYLHLVYIFLVLIGGAYLGKYILKARAWRWAVFFLAAYTSMFVVQRQLFAGTAHIELPGIRSANPWLQAFDWIRLNTPTDAYFAVDPNYMAAPGEDYHSFRAFAERSVLADGDKDTAVVTKVPVLGPEWHRQLAAQAGWPKFKVANFERLKSQFGVSWVLVSYPPPAGLRCAWHNDVLAVCRIP